MTPAQLSALLIELLQLPKESECVEFKHDNADPEKIGEYLSALANSAALHGRETAYIVWGIEDGTHKVVGTSFQPRKAKKGNEELENWLLHSLRPQINFRMHEWAHQGHRVVLFEIPCTVHEPVAFKGERWIRIGGCKKPLNGNPAKERELWAALARTPFEPGIAKSDLAADEALGLLDVSAFFDLIKLSPPADRPGILARLVEEKLVVSKPGSRWDITNLGAILLAKNLNSFDRLGRKCLRVVKYSGPGRTKTEREWHDPPCQNGYAISFGAAVSFITSQLPQNEPIGQAFREEVRMYPEAAIRELVANALIHQDFAVTGAGPMVEIFEGRMEITNPGEPLVDTMRFIDTPPRSRNEQLAAMMRRMNICEERGSGIDKVIEAVESFQLPAPNFTKPPGFTKATLFAHRKLTQMDKEARIRASYQHACLCFVSGRTMTNATLRQRFGIEDKNAARATRLIKETLQDGKIKLRDPLARRRDRAYLPFWA